MKYLIGSLLSVMLFTGGIYEYTVVSVTGTDINLETFQGKKILIVNVATGSPRAYQLRELQQLQELYSDSLIVIGFPSNSFGSENRSNLEIKEFCRLMHGATFLLAAKGPVRGDSIQPVYQWLTREGENGLLNSVVKGDFQKYLIDKSGNLQGVFSGSVSPLSAEITNLVSGSSN